MCVLNEQKLINIPVIDLDDIYLRAVEYNDYKDMFDYGSDSRVTKTTSWQYKTLEDAKSSIEEIHLSRPKRDLPLAYAIIYKENQKMIGTCDFHTIDWKTKTGIIGYILNYDYWGKGLMTKTCKALIDFGFHYLGLKTIMIDHARENMASQRVIEKCGFTFLKEEMHPKSKQIHRFYEMKSK